MLSVFIDVDFSNEQDSRARSLDGVDRTTRPSSSIHLISITTKRGKNRRFRNKIIRFSESWGGVLRFGLRRGLALGRGHLVPNCGEIFFEDLVVWVHAQREREPGVGRGKVTGNTVAGRVHGSKCASRLGVLPRGGCLEILHRLIAIFGTAPAVEEGLAFSIIGIAAIGYCRRGLGRRRCLGGLGLRACGIHWHHRLWRGGGRILLRARLRSRRWIRGLGLGCRRFLMRRCGRCFGLRRIGSGRRWGRRRRFWLGCWHFWRRLRGGGVRRCRARCTSRTLIVGIGPPTCRTQGHEQHQQQENSVPAGGLLFGFEERIDAGERLLPECIDIGRGIGFLT